MTQAALDKATQLAKASWIAPLLVIAVNYFLKQGNLDPSQAASRAAVFALIAAALGAVGLICGIMALTQVRKYGAKGILIPAIIGSVLSGLYVVVFVAALVRHAPN